MNDVNDMCCVLCVCKAMNNFVVFKCSVCFSNYIIDVFNVN